MSIVEIVELYTELKAYNDKLIGLCPFHKEKTPSFSVDPTAQTFHCFGCGVSGDSAVLLDLLEKNRNPFFLKMSEKSIINIDPQFLGKLHGFIEEYNTLCNKHDLMLCSSKGFTMIRRSSLTPSDIIFITAEESLTIKENKDDKEERP